LSILPHYLRLGRALIAALTLATMLANSQRAFAWKPKTHAHLAEVAYRDAVDDGLVTVYATDYQRGVIRRLRGNNNKVVIGTYRVYPLVPILSQPSAVLGLAMTLDGSNQWSANPGKLIAAGNIDFYRMIFMRHSGEKP
jgi:hypothetical protein